LPLSLFYPVNNQTWYLELCNWIERRLSIASLGYSNNKLNDGLQLILRKAIMPEVQKQGKPTDAKADEWDRDLHPNSMPGQNQGLRATQSQSGNFPTANEIKDLTQLLQDFTDEELKQISVVPHGTHLEQGATYVDLLDPDRQEFTAMGNMTAIEGHWYIPKSEVHYELWNRLTLANNPQQTGTGVEQPPIGSV
jgi:hypothetical protein